MNLLYSIFGSLVVAAVLAVIGYMYRAGTLDSFWDWIVTWIRLSSQSFSKTSHTDSAKVRAILLTRLRRDQCRSGVHYGQFGRGVTQGEEKKYQTGAENLSVKPRMYLTVWPSVVLAKHNLAPRMLVIARKGVEQLYHNNRIHVYQSATRHTPPHSQPHIISYRHTICGALILYHLKGSKSIVRNVIDAMIDERNHWQKTDGGWAQCDREHTASDLWGSAYALRLLSQVVADPATFSEHERNSFSQAIARTLHYFTTCWEKKKWSYGGSTSPENSVLLLIEIAPILGEVDPAFLNSVLRSVREWLSLSGNLSESYRDACKEVSHAALNARMSYALCRSSQPVESWHSLYLQATENLDQNLNSADMSFLIELSYRADSAVSGRASSLTGWSRTKVSLQSL